MFTSQKRKCILFEHNLIMLQFPSKQLSLNPLIALRGALKNIYSVILTTSIAL